MSEEYTCRFCGADVFSWEKHECPGKKKAIAEGKWPPKKRGKKPPPETLSWNQLVKQMQRLRVSAKNTHQFVKAFELALVNNDMSGSIVGVVVKQDFGHRKKMG